MNFKEFLNEEIRTVEKFDISNGIVLKKGISYHINLKDSKIHRKNLIFTGKVNTVGGAKIIFMEDPKTKEIFSVNSKNIQLF